MLDDEAEVVTVGPNQIQIAGAKVARGPEAKKEAGYRERVGKILQNRKDGIFNIFMAHFPESGAMGLEYGADPALSGDTHGGQVRLPLFGGVKKLRCFGKYFDIGLQQIAGRALYVSRGIGMEGNAAPRIRFLCPPELIRLSLGCRFLRA